MAAYAAAGCAYIAVPYLEEACRPGHDGFSDVIAALPKLGEAAGRAGLTLLYHNHDFEFTKVEGQYGLDLMYQRVPASLLQTELDTCWINVAGENPAAYLAKYTGRAPVVHLKDFVLEAGSPPICMTWSGWKTRKSRRRERALPSVPGPRDAGHSLHPRGGETGRRPLVRRGAG